MHGNNITLAGLDVYDNGGIGIAISGNNPTFTNNTVAGNYGNGICVTGDGATITGNTVLYNVGSGIIVNGANSNVTGNDVDYNGHAGILVNGEVIGNGTYNGLIVSGPALLGLLSQYGTINLGEGVPVTIDSVLAAADGVIDAFVADFAAIELTVSRAGVVGLAVAVSLVGVYLTVKYPNEYPQTVYTLEGTLISPELLPLTIYTLQSVLHGDGNPLTPEILQEDYWKGVNLIIEISDSEDYKDIRKEIKEKAEKGDFNGVQDIIDNVAGLGGIPGDPRTNDDYKNWGEKIHEDWDEFVNALKRGEVGSAAENGLILSIETGTYPLAVTGEVIVDYYNKMTGRT
ncbi:parallel beta-helix repeat protein [Methanobacterium aggregans]|nr:parallel beta-helix repeat protein [Methanobacterium aggregans]